MHQRPLTPDPSHAYISLFRVLHSPVFRCVTNTMAFIMYTWSETLQQFKNYEKWINGGRYYLRRNFPIIHVKFLLNINLSMLNDSGMSNISLESTGLCVMPVTFLHFSSLSHTPQTAKNVAIASAPVHVCDVNPEQPTDVFFKKNPDLLLQQR